MSLLIPSQLVYEAPTGNLQSSAEVIQTSLNPVKQIFPDRSQSANAVKTSCEAAGGHYQGLECVYPPPPPPPALKPPTTPQMPIAVMSSDDNFYKSFIYAHESGNDPTRWNSEGCLGLGQACPASKLLAVCPTMDYGCEDAFFTQYALDRYRGWAGAYRHWVAAHWW